MSVAVVIPTYNEAENIPTLLTRLFALPIPVSVWIVDDSSRDGTALIAKSLGIAHRWPVIVIQRSTRGLATAYRDGFTAALASGEAFEHIGQMDADLSHEPEALPRLLDAAHHARIAVGSRWVTGGGPDASWPITRIALSRAGSFYCRQVLGIPQRDATSGFKIFERFALQACLAATDRRDTRGFVFQVEMSYAAHQLGMRVAEVPITFRQRAAGKSKMSTRIILEGLRAVPALRFGATRLRT